MKAMMGGFLLVLAVGGIESISHTLRGQPSGPRRYVIRGTAPTCTTCSIELVRLTLIGSEEAPEVLTPGGGTVDQRARTVAFSTIGQRIVFDSAGRRLALFSRRGRGPGEYDGVEGETFGAGDTLYVFEPGLGRVTVFSPDFQFVRTAPFPSNPTSQFVALGGDQFVIASSYTRPTANRPVESLGDPLHLVSDGKVVRSFGTDSVPAPGSLGAFGEKDRHVAFSTRGRVWSAHHFRYILERWDTTGTHELSIVREVDWFPIVTAAYGDPMLNRPTSSLIGVWEDSDGRVWTLIRVADANWRARVQREPTVIRRGSIGRPPTELLDSMYDSIVEVFDPERGVLLASRRLPQALTLCGRGFLRGERESPDGAYQKEIWRIRLGAARPAGKRTRR